MLLERDSSTSGEITAPDENDRPSERTKQLSRYYSMRYLI